MRPDGGISRRRTMALMAATMAAPLAGCPSTPSPTGGRPPREIIDVHAHAFNASDLPVERFIRYCLLELQPEQGEAEIQEIQDPDFIDGLIQLFIRILGADRAPTARAELDYLTQDDTSPVEIQAEDDLDTLIIRRVAAFLEEPSPMGLDETAGIDDVKDAILRAAETVPADTAPVLPNGSELIAPDSTSPALLQALRAYFSDTLIGRALRWFKLFKMYRHALVEKWIADQTTQGVTPLLMAPALIDYSCWLQQSVDGSPLAEQVQVMGLIGRRQTKVAVHGYVAFDPLRHAYFRRGIALAEFDPLAVARQALVEHGFLGVKLYPPMGFKPIENDNDITRYHRHIGDNLGTAIGTELDASLKALYTLCEELAAPILAHATDSNESGPGYQTRADPHFWRPVFRDHATLHICLAHFGRFKARSADTDQATPLPAASWEWNFGRFVRDNPNAPVFADLSFWSETLTGSSAARAKLAETMRAYIAAFDSNVEHLMFGTDWIMVGIARGYQRYDTSVIDFLKNACRLDDAAVDRILVGNARRFLRLNPGEPTRQRLDSYYAAKGMAPRVF